MIQEARITYQLSESGRKDSLRKGGDGKRRQFETGVVANPKDIDLFVVDDEGNVTFDASIATDTFEVDNRRHYVILAGTVRAGDQNSPQH